MLSIARILVFTFLRVESGRRSLAIYYGERFSFLDEDWFYE
jgi:hypothetical protein